MWKKKKRKEQFAFNAEKVFLAATQPLGSVFSYFQTSRIGLTADEVEKRQSVYGRNEVEHEKKKNPLSTFIKAFINPFIGVLTGLVVISFVLDVLLAAPGEQDWTAIVIISTMVIFSAILRFCQEWKANASSEALLKMVTNTCYVKRAGNHDEEINIAELVPGDVVMIAAGDMIPADIRIIEAKDLFVSQSSLTGESDPIEKHPEVKGKKYNKGSVVELDNICYMGSNVVSGSATGIVFETGNNTYLGTIAKSIVGHRAATAFDKGINKVSILLIRFMLVMIPFVFLVNGLTKGDWFDAFIFAISVAVGLTPEMLPMIVTANLSKGAVAMSKKKTIVKDLNAIQNFGAMNILCTDKTGTLTCDQIVLEKYINADGSSDNDKRILRHAYFNSFFQTGLKNLMDKAILSHIKELSLEYLKDNYKKVDEIPFDFARRRMSVVVEDKQGKRQIITKGAVEEMLDIARLMFRSDAYRLVQTNFYTQAEKVPPAFWKMHAKVSELIVFNVSNLFDRITPGKARGWAEYLNRLIADYPLNHYAVFYRDDTGERANRHSYDVFCAHLSPAFAMLNERMPLNGDFYYNRHAEGVPASESFIYEVRTT